MGNQSKGGLVVVATGTTLIITSPADQRIQGVTVTGLSSQLNFGLTSGATKSIPGAPSDRTVKECGGDVYYGMASASYYPSADIKFTHAGPFRSMWFDNTAGFGDVPFSLQYVLSPAPIPGE